MTDYRKLMMELFGTADENEIRNEVRRLKNRNAGRKAVITDEIEERVRHYASMGDATGEIARKVGISRQSVSKALNRKPEEGYTMRMIYMFRNQPCTQIDINFLEKRVKILNRTEDRFHRAFGVNETPSWKDLEIFLESRCYPKTRENIREILEKLGMMAYDPFVMIEKTQGRCYEDDMWIKVVPYPRKKV